MPVMNERQYNIVKCIMLMGAPAKKFAGMIHVDVLEVLKVQNTASYEQYKNLDDGNLDSFSSLFGMGI